MIITQFNLIDTLLVECPAFRPEIEAFVTRYDPPPAEGLPHYMLMGDFVEACSERLQQGRDDEIAGLFKQVERWIEQGDKYVSDLAVIGFIEDMQNGNIHNGTKPEEFIRFLGPRSRRYWDKVNRFWSHGEIIYPDT